MGANGALAGFGVGADAGGLGLGEEAGGDVAGEDVEGEGEALADDACSFANRFMRICGGNVGQHMHTNGGRDAYAVSIVGGIGQGLARAHDHSGFLVDASRLGSLCRLRGSRLGRFDYIIDPFPPRPTTMIMLSAFALLSSARQAIVLSPRLFSTSAMLGYPKLKSHSGTKKRWRALASGAFKRVSTVSLRSVRRIITLPFTRHILVIPT